MADPQRDPERPPQAYGGAPGNIVGRTSSPGRTILLTIVTLGIWSYVWLYRQHEDIKAYSGEGVGGGLGLVIYFFVSPVTFFLLANEVETKLYQRSGQESPVRTITGLWYFLPIIGWVIWYLRVQRAINDFWVSKGAEAPA